MLCYYVLAGETKPQPKQWFIVASSRSMIATASPSQQVAAAEAVDKQGSFRSGVEAAGSTSSSDAEGQLLPVNEHLVERPSSDSDSHDETKENNEDTATMNVSSDSIDGASSEEISAADETAATSSLDPSADTGCDAKASVARAETRENNRAETRTGPVEQEPPTTRGEGAAKEEPIRRLPSRQQQITQRLAYDAAQTVLQEIRRDARYVNPARFTEELTVTEVYGHSLHLSFQELLPKLSSSGSTGDDGREDATFFLDPFCEAVKQKDNSAAVVSTILQILTKFLDYGLVDDESGLQKIASAVVQCPWWNEEPANSNKPAEGGVHRRQSSIILASNHHNPVKHASSMDSGLMEQQQPSASTLGLGRRRSNLSRALSSEMVTSGDTNPTSYHSEVALKILQLAVKTVQSAISNNNDDGPLLSGKCLMELLESCWSVAASSSQQWIQSTAQTACQQIVATVVGGSSSKSRCSVLKWLSNILSVEATDTTSQTKTREKRTDSVSSTRGNFTTKHETHVTALSLVSTALDLIVTVTEEERLLLETIAKHVLVLAIPTASDQTLQTSFRVLFQLVDCLQLRHLKCEVELLLQNVHLRRLKESSSPEETEAVLESLLELCYGGGALQLRDLYLNYDCDGACTNLFEEVLTALGRTACPDGWSIAGSKEDTTEAPEEADPESKSLPGSAASESTAGPNSNNKTNVSSLNGVSSTTEPATKAAATSANKPLPVVSTHAPLNHLNRLALEGVLSVLDSIAQRCSSSYDPNADQASTGSAAAAGDAITEEELFLRKQKKNAMVKVMQSFNSENPDKGEFLKIAVAEGLLKATSDAAKVAELLYHAPEDLDKRRLGIYLSRGPEKNFPFQASVRNHFAECYDFTALTFAASLRKFLSKFRLPGEAQLIDRLMEAFSKEVYRQQAGEGRSHFKNADAVYVLAFSTIMLNTDLHNPTIKTQQRMTKEQFLKNNRGINGGEDLPESFLSELYDEIKNRQLQVRHDAGDFLKKRKEYHSCAWDGILDRKKEIAPPVTLVSSKEVHTGLQDKEMFLILVRSSLQAVSGVFTRSYDDALVVRTLRGLQQMVKVAAHFEFDKIINDVLQLLLPQGRDYVLECIAFDQQQQNTTTDVEESVGTPGHPRTSSTDSLFEDETTIGADNDQRIPYGLLCSSDERGQVEISGSASNRGLLALDSSFVLLRKYSKGVTDAWPAFFECLCAMRDCHSLPSGLSDLDDFADSNGNVLPLSSFAKASKKRLDDYHRSLSDSNTHEQKGWFRSLFRKGQTGEQHESSESNDDDQSISPKGMYSKTLLGVAKAADVENIVQMGSSHLPDTTVRDLLDKLDLFPFTNDPVSEQHAVFSLEMAARALLLNRERAEDLFLLFLSKFESILCKATESDDDNVAAPFVVERIVVTILRSSIHLYELEEVRRKA